MSMMLSIFKPIVVFRPSGEKEQRHTSYPRGTLKELFEYVKIRSYGAAIEIDYHLLTSSNVATLHQEAYRQRQKLHIIRKGTKRILWTNPIN